MRWVHFLRVLHAFYIISVRATNYFKKQKSLGISCEAFIGAYDFCTLSITEVMNTAPLTHIRVKSRYNAENVIAQNDLLDEAVHPRAKNFSG